MKKLNRQIFTKKINPKDKTITAYVSTFAFDRMDERFEKGGWSLDNFKSNPVVLWAHNGGQPPIAKAGRIEEDDKGLLATMEFDKESAFAMEIFGMFERGFMNSFSVGFIPKAHRVEAIPDSESKGIVYTESELVEFSAVPVPANPGARVDRAAAQMMIKTFGIKSIIESKEESKESHTVQLLIFPKIHWTQESATEWATENDFNTENMDETETAFRFTQRPEDDFVELATVCLNPDRETDPGTDDCLVKASVGTLKEEMSVVYTVADLPKEKEEKFIPTKEYSDKKNSEEFVANLKSLIELAKITKNQKLDSQKLELAKTAIAVLNEMAFESCEEATPEECEMLQKMVKDLTEVLVAKRPDVQDYVSKFMTQFNIAVKSNRTN